MESIITPVDGNMYKVTVTSSGVPYVRRNEASFQYLLICAHKRDNRALQPVLVDSVRCSSQPVKFAQQGLFDQTMQGLFGQDWFVLYAVRVPEGLSVSVKWEPFSGWSYRFYRGDALLGIIEHRGNWQVRATDRSTRGRKFETLADAVDFAASVKA